MLCALLVPLALFAPPTGPVDWRNQSYVIDGTPITVKDGAYLREPTDDETGESLDLGSVIPADLDGDGRPEYVVTLNYWGGGTGRFDELHIYRVVGGQKMFAGRVPGGDRGDGGHGVVKVDGDRVRVERLSALPWEGTCCPSFVVVESWRWDGGRMVRDIERSMIEPMEEGGEKPARAAALAAARAAMKTPNRNPQTAIEHLITALRTAPGDAEILGELGFAMKAEKIPEAEAALWAAAGGKGTDAVRAAALYNLARLYLDAGDRTRATDAAQRSLVLRPDNAPTRKLLAEATAAGK